MALTVETESPSESIAANRRELMDELIAQIDADSADWRHQIVRTVAAWPVETETVYGETFHYFIGGEAVNWKRLAERIATQVRVEAFDSSRADVIFEWIETSNVFGGLDEQEFRRILGVDGWRAHLNHFYGVQIERCMLTASQSRIDKRRYSLGMPPSDDASDRAFMGLYEDTEDVLWDCFVENNASRLTALFEDLPDDTRSNALDEEFTYWLFKRRIEYTNAAQVAAETQRGLDMLARIGEADERRARMLKDTNGGALLEFGLVNRRNGKAKR